MRKKPMRHLNIDKIRKRPSAASGRQLATRLIAGSIGALALLGLSLLLTMQAGQDDAKQMPNREAFHNYQRIRPKNLTNFNAIEVELTGPDGAPLPFDVFDSDRPNDEILKAAEEAASVMVSASGSVPVTGQSLREKLVAQIAARNGSLTPFIEGQLDVVAGLTKPPLFTLQTHVGADLLDVPSPKTNLRREYAIAEAAPLPGADREKGPFYEPRQVETSWIAYDGLVADVAEAGAKSIEEASNGEHPLHAELPEALTTLRGRVFDFEGTLWSLRKMPLRRAVKLGDREVTESFQGIVVRLRKGVRGEPSWVNESAMFTALDLPSELAKHAKKPGEFPSNADALARGTVWIRLSGAFFRRIASLEPVAELAVLGPPQVEGGDDKEERRRYWTEAYVPWLVAQTATLVEPKWPEVAAVREVVQAFSESLKTQSVAESKEALNIFDEAGYYLLLRSMADPNSPWKAIPETELTLRKLARPELRGEYRGGRGTAIGFLQPEFFPVILPPNVSGLRHIYRTYLLEADRIDEARQELQWYVDVIEPPADIRGHSRVKATGIYYRSQEWLTKINGENQLVSMPLLLAPKLERAVGTATDDGGVDLTVPLAAAAAVIVLVLVFIVIGRSDARQRRKFEAETLRKVRERFTEGSKPGTGGTDGTS